MPDNHAKPSKPDDGGRIVPLVPLPGFVDVYGLGARKENYEIARILSLFESWGYIPLKMPIIEHASCFSEAITGHSPWPEWSSESIFSVDLPSYGMNYDDKRGVEPGLLIPEGTISVTRWLAHQMTTGSVTFPIKLYYHCDCFRNEPLDRLTSTKRRHFEQLGMEIMGTGSESSDLETLLLIGEGLTVLGVPRDRIRMRISDISLFANLSAELKLTESQRVKLKEHLDAIAEFRAKRDVASQKNERSTLLTFLLSDCALPRAHLAAWEALTDTSTRERVTPSLSTLLPVEVLKKIDSRVSAIQRAGYDAIADLAVVRSHEYYTGMTMEVDVVTPGQTYVEVAGGGRYDRLVGKFLGSNETIPSVGFAFGLQRLGSFLEFSSDTHDIPAWSRENDADVVLPPSGDSISDYCVAQSLRDGGARVDVYVGDNADNAIMDRYARVRGAKLHMPASHSQLTDLFDDSYPALFFDTIPQAESKAEAVDALKLLGVSSDHRIRILDVPCGIGRHTVEFALLGHHVLAIDRSQHYLARLASSASKLGVQDKIEIRQGDLRWLDAGISTVDAAIVLFNSIGYYGEETDRVMFKAIARALRPGGSVVVQAHNRDWILSHFEGHRWRTVDKTTLLEHNTFDVATSSTIANYELIREGKPTHRYSGKFRLYSPHELSRALLGAGFSGVKLMSTLQGQALDVSASPTVVVVASK